MGKPRFIVEECEQCSDDRQFKNGEVVFNQRLGMAYSVEEIVEVLNVQGESDDYLFELLQMKIWYCQLMYKRSGDEIYRIEESCLRQLRDEIYDKSSISKYSEVLKEHMEQRE